jgi:hypothetical protein
VALPQELDEQGLRSGTVVVADARGSKETVITRVATHVFADPPPEQMQGSVFLLVLNPHEGTAELERRPEALDESAAELEKGRRVKAALSEASHDPVGARDAIRAYHASLSVAPENEVLVVVIEEIDIDSAPGAFACRTKCHLAESANLLQKARNTRTARSVHTHPVRGDETRQRSEARELFLELTWRLLRSDRAGRLDGCALRLAGDRISECVRAHAQVASELAVIGESRNAVRPDGLADANGHAQAALVERLVREQRGAHALVQQSGQLKGSAVLSAEMHCDDGSPGLANQA